MKAIILFCLTIGMLILMPPVFTKASSLMLSSSSIDSVPVSAISNGCTYNQYAGVLDLKTEKTEIHIIVSAHGCIMPTKILHGSEFIEIFYFNKSIQNQMSTPIPREYISCRHYSRFFTGVLLI